MAPSRKAGRLVWLAALVALAGRPSAAVEAVLVRLDAGATAVWLLRGKADWQPQQILTTPDGTVRLLVAGTVGAEVTTRVVPPEAAARLALGQRVDLATGERATTPVPTVSAPAPVATGTISRLAGEQVGVSVGAPPVSGTLAVVRRGDREIGRLEWRGPEGSYWAARRVDGQVPWRLGDRVTYQPTPVAAGSAGSDGSPATARRPRTWGQEDVMPGDDPSYKILAALAARGAIPNCSARQFAGDLEAVYTRGQLVVFVERFLYALIDRDQVSRSQDLSPQMAGQARLLVDRFRPDLVARGLPLEQVEKALVARGAPQLAWAATALGVARAGSGDRHASTVRLDASVLGGFERRLRFGGTLSTEGGEALPNTRDRSGVAALWVEGDVARNLSLGAGRRVFRFGPGANDLLWSDRAKPFDQIYGLWRTKLFGQPLSISQHVGWYRNQGDKFITLRRVQYLPMRRLEVSFSEGLITRNGTQTLVTGVLPLYWSRFVGGNFSTGGSGNYAFELDATYRVNRTLSVYGQFFADDLDLSGVHRTPHYPGYLGGIRYVPMGLPGSSYRLEVAVLPSANTYVQPADPALRWYRDGVVLGHEYGPEGAGIRFDGRQRLSQRLDVGFGLESFARNRKLAVPQEFVRIQFRLGYDLTSFWAISGGLNYLHELNRNGVRGDNHTNKLLYLQTQVGY